MKRLFILGFILISLFSLSSAGLAGSSPPSAEDWKAFKEEIGQANELVKNNQNAAFKRLNKAKELYENKFLSGAIDNTDLKLQIDSAWAGAKEAALNGGELKLAIETEMLEKTTLALISATFTNLMQKKQVAQAYDWFTVIATQLKLTEDNELVKQMQQLKDKGSVSPRDGQKVSSKLAGVLADKVAEEIDEALEAANPESGQADLAEAQIKAAEGLGYWQSLKPFSLKKLGYKDTALIEGLLHQIRSALADKDVNQAEQAAETLKGELEELASAKKVAVTEFATVVNEIQSILTHASKEVNEGQTEQAKTLAADAWSAFTKIEAEIRRLDVSRYVLIEKLFPKVQERPAAEDIEKLKDLFNQVLAVKSGKTAASEASLDQVIVTGFENIQPFFFAFLALLGIYPVYLILKAFGWGHRAWRNIGIFIILLIVPVFMEALGRLGVEFKIVSLQALSFTVNEYAKMAWGLIILIAFLFAISGLRQFCAQFGVKAFGVKSADEEPIPAQTEAST